MAKPLPPMTAEQLAVLADDIADMAQDFIDSRDAKSLRNMATNLARMIRIHVPAATEMPEAPSCVEHGTMVPDDEMGRSWHCACCSFTFSPNTEGTNG